MVSGRNGTNPEFPERPSIASLFPAYKSDTDAGSEYNQIPPNFSHHDSPLPAYESDTDTGSEYNQIPPNFSHYNSYSIVSIFPPTRSQTDETTIQISIPLLFPPTVSETEIDGSASSESNEAHPRVSNSIMSIFPPVRSPSKTTLDHSVNRSYLLQRFMRSLSLVNRPDFASLPPRRSQIIKKIVEELLSNART